MLIVCMETKDKLEKYGRVTGAMKEESHWICQRKRKYKRKIKLKNSLTGISRCNRRLKAFEEEVNELKITSVENQYENKFKFRK